MKLVILVCIALALFSCNVEAKSRFASFMKSFTKGVTGIAFKDCGSETGTISSVTVTDCTAIPCIFEKGKNYTLTLNLDSKVNSKSVSNLVYGVIAKIPVPFHLPNADGCSMGISCPVKSGDSLSESVTLPILSEYPKLSLYVKWEVMDDSNKQMACFIFPVKIQ